MDNSNTICPVCTLYLREGVTLQAHLDTHPKDQVIQALLKVSNLGTNAQAKQPAPTTGNTFGAVQSFSNANTSFVTQASPYNNNPQTQLTTAVTYQHFMTSNGSSGIMPQYIQVPTIINPSTVVSNQTVDFSSNQGINYAQTMYNPLYNPYIPHPYPFNQPVYASFPVNSMPSVDSNTQLNRTPVTTVTSQVATTVSQPSVIVTRSTVSTSTDADKKTSKISRTKKTYVKAAIKKVKNFKQRTSDSVSSKVVVKPKPASTSRIITRKIAPKPEMPKTVTEPPTPTTSATASIICPPPLTPITGTTKRSITGSKTPPPPPLSKAPCFVTEMLSYSVKSEDLANSVGPEPTSVVEYLDQKPNSASVENNNLLENKEKSIDIMEEEQHTVVNMEIDEGSDWDFNENIVEEEERLDEDEDEKLRDQEKVFHMIEVEEETKIQISEVTINRETPNEISSDNIERNCDGSEIFIQHENIHMSGAGFEKDKECQYPELTGTKCKSSGMDTQSEYELYGKELSVQNEKVGDEAVSKPMELQTMTYTDLQPAKSTKVFQDLGLSTSSLNFNNVMEVEGIKIFFNNGTSTVPFDPLMKIQGSRNITTFMKTENQVTSQTVVDSVIQLVSSGNTDPKSEVTFGDPYPPTTSHVNDVQLDMSPLPLNIQADESMPARGELSEQESLGAENSTWNLFHNSNSTKQEDWANDNNNAAVSVIGSKPATKSFKCSICNEVFSCPKERRVHKNNVHAEKSSPAAKKPKRFACSTCGEVLPSLRERRLHVIQKHPSTKAKKASPIKEEKAEPECVNIDIPDPSPIKSEETVKTETVVVPETDNQRVKYCGRCSLPFVGAKKLREHLRITHGEVRFKCEKCSATFDEESEFNSHLLIHPLVCVKCGKSFHKKPNLNLHMKRHLEVKPYECNLCPKSFITRQKLEEHMNGHSGKKPVKCNLCDKTFNRHSNLIQHRNLHHSTVKKKLKDFVCRCGEVFHSLRKLEWHKEVHESKPKPCPFCSQKFIHSASVTRHIRRSHIPDYLPGDNREFDNVQCPICEKVYLRSSLVVHMRVHNGEKPFSCKICNKQFSTKWNLELHSWTHQSRSNMPFKCQICKSAFFRETDFVAHLNSHRNYKPYTCNICGQKFIRKYSCLRHQEEHKKSKQFVCAVSGCAKSFHRGYYLRDHMKVHTGLRPHTCHICGKASSTKSNHNKHVRIHDTREPVNTEN